MLQLFPLLYFLFALISFSCPLPLLCDDSSSAYLGDLIHKTDVHVGLGNVHDSVRQRYITNAVQASYLRRCYDGLVDAHRSDHYLGTVFECSYNSLPDFRRRWVSSFYLHLSNPDSRQVGCNVSWVSPIFLIPTTMSQTAVSSNPTPLVDRPLPPAPTQAVTLADDPELLIDLTIVGGGAATTHCANLRTHTGVSAVTTLWRDVRLDRITFNVSLLTDGTVFQAALTHNAITGSASSIAKSVEHTSLRRTDLATGAASAQLTVPQGVDKQLAPTSPLTTGGPAHLTVYFNGGAREYVTIRLHCHTGGPARHVADFV
jgi:hypothetical protein